MTDLSILLTTAVSVGLIHTLLGPDHYVPFVALAKARNWPLHKTLWVTLICGMGHVGGSVLLGCVGLALGLLVVNLETIEAARGTLAGWFLIAFGLGYLAWGIAHAVRDVPHVHLHAGADGTIHVHSHTHEPAEVAARASTYESLRRSESSSPGTAERKSFMPQLLFAVFLLGPCEPLIPLVMYPAATMNAKAVALVTLGFSAATLGTMISCVAIILATANRFPKWNLGRAAHALAGAAVLACGVLIQLGL